MEIHDLRRIMHGLGISISDPNHAGWSHCACPFAPFPWGGHKHGVDRSEGFALKVEKGISAYTCPVCKRHGRISSLIRVMEAARGTDYTELAMEADNLDMVSSILPSFDQMSQAKAKPQPIDESLFEGMFQPVAEVPRAVEYLASRFISPEAAIYADLGWDQVKRRIVFPVRDGNGELFGWSGRATHAMQNPKVLDYSGLPKRSLILGEHKWVVGKPVLIVEGLMAYGRFITEGAHEHANVGALLGSELTEEKEAILKHWGLPVYFWVDPDEAGDACLYGKAMPDGSRNHARGAIARLRTEIPVFVPEYPQGITDPDDLSLKDILHAMKNTPLASV